MDAARKIVNIDDVGPSASRKKRKGAAIVIVVVVLIIAGVFLGLTFVGRKDIPLVKDYETSKVAIVDLVTTIEASGTVILPTQITIPSPQEGYANKISVKEGDKVKKGDILAVLDVPNLENDMDDLRASLVLAKLALKEQTTNYEYSIKNLKLSLFRIEEQVAEAEKTVKTKKELASLKSSRQSEYENALDSLETQLQKKEDAGFALAKEEDMKNISLEKQKASITQLEVSLKRALEGIEEAKIKAPLSGEVLSINSKLGVPGSLIEKNATVMTVADRSDTCIDFEVDQQYSSVLSEGKEIAATVGTQTLMTKIVSIGKVASLSTDGLTATVVVRTKPTEALSLTPGASAAATISLGTKRGALSLPRGAYLTTGSQKYVYRIEGGKAAKIAVSFGQIQGTRVEVLKGLSAGDEIISSGYQNFIDSDVVALK